MSTYIKKGYGFHVGVNFARANEDVPISRVTGEYADPRHVIGYIAAMPESPLCFLRRGDKDGMICVHVHKSALCGGE